MFDPDPSLFFFFVEHCEKSRGETERGGRRGSVEIKGEKREKGGGPLSGAALDRGGAQSGSTRCTMTSKTGSWALWSPRCSHGTRVHPGGEGSF